MPLPPSAVMSSSVAAQSLMSAAITRAPASARLRANSWPRPRAAPVIATTLSRTSISTSRNQALSRSRPASHRSPLPVSRQGGLAKFRRCYFGAFAPALQQKIPLPGLDPGIHASLPEPALQRKRRGWLGQARPQGICGGYATLPAQPASVPRTALRFTRSWMGGAVSEDLIGARIDQMHVVEVG